MSEQKNQMAVRYKSLADGENAGYRLENSIDKIFSPGCYIVEVDHRSGGLGLPVSYCGEEHYLVGTLIVTDSGTVGSLQKNRVAGQVLTFTSRKNKDTVLYIRTYADGKWGEWHSLVRTGMYDNITNTDELVASVTQLVMEVNEMETNLNAEVTRATGAESELAAELNKKIDGVEGNVHKTIINYNVWKATDAELSLPNILADEEFVKLVTCGTILTYKNTSAAWKRFQYVSENVSPEYVKSYSNWRELSGVTYGIKQTADTNKVQISTTGENGSVKDILNISAATAERAGVMSAADKKKLDDNATAVEAEVERATAAEAVAIEQGRKLALRDLFTAAGALYNNTGADIARTAPWGETVVHKVGHYYLNGLGDITEKEMLDIYNVPHNKLYEQGYVGIRTRTVFFHGSSSTAGLTRSPNGLFMGCNALKVVAGYGVLYFAPSCENVKYIFRGCTNLEHIVLEGFYGRYVKIEDTAFKGCSSLVTIKITQLEQGLSFADSPQISKESILFIINEAIPTSAITITLHADAYARLADDADVVDALSAQPFVSLVSA